MRWNWRAAILALLALVVAVAPIAAQALMALADPGKAVRTVQATKPCHGEAHSSDRDIGHAGKMDAGSTPAPPGHPVGHHEHGDGPGAGCCGTFCHSVFFLTASVFTPVLAGRPAFAWTNGRLLASVDPDQLQRPPSRLLSL